MPTIAIANKCPSLVDDATAQKWVDAVQRQVAGDFAPVWGASAILHYVGNGAIDVAPDAWLLNLVATSSEQGTLGVHWLDGARPIGEIGVQTCKDDGVEPSSCLSHETLEMILDPYAVLAAQVGSLMLSYEVCDRVESSDSSYTIDGVLVENFSLPAAFNGCSGPWDFRKKCSSNIVLPGGYQLQVDLGSSTWSQVTGKLARKSKQAAGAGSRRASRMKRAGADPKSLVVVPA